MAVYTPISAENLRQHLTGFNIGGLLSFEGITEGIDNTNYKITTTQGLFILTLCEKRIRPENLPFYITFMEHLRSSGVPSPEIVADKGGEKIVSLLGKPALIATFLEGQWPRQIESFHVAATGRTLARMHLAGKEFKQQLPNPLSLAAWEKLIDRCADKCDSALLQTLQEELAALEKNWPQNLPRGAIHADLFPDNVFFSGQELTGIIDFYFSCTDAFVYDLMLTLNAWCFNKTGMPAREKTTAFLAAYQEERPLTVAEKEAMPFFGRAAAVRIIATRLYDSLHPVPGAAVRLKDPMEYVRILKFHQTGNILS